LLGRKIFPELTIARGKLEKVSGNKVDRLLTSFRTPRSEFVFSLRVGVVLPISGGVFPVSCLQGEGSDPNMASL
jgi:hypothetical protein